MLWCVDPLTRKCQLNPRDFRERYEKEVLLCSSSHNGIVWQKKEKKKECEYLRHIKNKQYKQVYMPRTATKINGT